MSEIYLCFYCHPESGYLRRRVLNKDYQRKKVGRCNTCDKEATLWSVDKKDG